MTALALPTLGRAGTDEGAVRPRTDRLAVARLTLTDFRNYAGLRLGADDRPVVLTGPNGAGKTNLLEAISLLAPGRGLRRAKLRELDRRGGGAWAVAAVVETPAGAVEIGTGKVEVGEGERRVVHIDGEPIATQTALAEQVSCVWLTPAMDRLLAESASPRRRFLDRLVFNLEPEHAHRVGAYEHALRERGRLLRAGRADPAWLGALEARMAKHGVAIAAARRRTAEGLNGALAERAGAPFPGAVLSVRGKVETWLEADTESNVEPRLGVALAENRGRDAETGFCAVGPHRSDLAVHDLDHDEPAARGSTGRQKALLLAVTLAEARLRASRGAPLPLLLLDEVAAHLDLDRREALCAELVALGAQVWLTGTDAELFAPLRGHAQFLTVRDAALTHGD